MLHVAYRQFAPVFQMIFRRQRKIIVQGNVEGDAKLPGQIQYIRCMAVHMMHMHSRDADAAQEAQHYFVILRHIEIGSKLFAVLVPGNPTD